VSSYDDGGSEKLYFKDEGSHYISFRGH